MSKSNQACIKIVNRNGYLFLSVSFKGVRKFKTLGFKCPIQCWNADRECCTSSLKNYKMINVQISKMKMDMIERMNKFVMMNMPYTVDMLLEEEVVKDLNGASLSFNSFLSSMLTEKQLSVSTQVLYRYAGKKLLAFLNRDDVLVTECDTAMAVNFQKHLLKDGMSPSSATLVLTRVKAVLYYAQSKDLLQNVKFEFKADNSTSKIRPILNKFQMDMLFDWYYDLMCEDGVNGGWRYRGDSFINLATVRTSIECRIGLFLFSFLCQGLAPIDCCLLRREDVSMVQVGEDMYYRIEWRRKKTGKAVKVLVKKDRRSLIIFQSLMGVGTGPFLFPVFNDTCVDNEVNQRTTINHYLDRARKTIQDTMKLVNQNIIQYNIENSKNEKLIPDGVTYYSARHSFASLLVNSGASLNGIASLLGRSVVGLDTYLHQLTEDDDIAAVRAKAGL